MRSRVEGLAIKGEGKRGGSAARVYGWQSTIDLGVLRAEGVQRSGCYAIYLESLTQSIAIEMNDSTVLYPRSVLFSRMIDTR